VRDINTNQNIPVNGSVYSGTYHDDFGCGFTQYFTTSGLCQTDRPVITRNGNTLACTPATSYQWYHNGVAISGATNSTYVMVVNDGNYTVMITDGNGCTSNSATYAVIDLGVSEVDLSSVSVAPNPTKDAFAITVSSELVGLPYSLTGSDRQGYTDRQIEQSIHFCILVRQSLRTVPAASQRSKRKNL
jgi:hypothetical protein